MWINVCFQTSTRTSVLLRPPLSQVTNHSFQMPSLRRLRSTTHAAKTVRVQFGNIGLI